ncbi:hypothetical protein PFY10_07000 [Chryseobacterium daecheongense]|nr:hypothetical protein PFY10_07000 [Chryseobacterium daecheongense]
MKKIDIAKLEDLSKKYKDKQEGKQKIVFEASGQGSFYIYEKTKDAEITTSVSKKDFKVVAVTKSIKKLKENITEFYTYSSEGFLQRYIESQNTTKIQDPEIGEIVVERYVLEIEKFDENGLIKVHKNYNTFFKTNLQDIIAIAKKNNNTHISVYKLYLDDDLSAVPILGLTKDDFAREKPFWIIQYKESIDNDAFVFRIYDGVSGAFIIEKNSRIKN